MYATVVILSALAASAAAHTAYATVDVVITSCPPEVSSCPGKNTPAAQHPEMVYSTVGVTVTSCGPEASSCPGKPSTPATYPAGTESSPAPGTEVSPPPGSEASVPHASSVPALTPPSDTYPTTVPSSSLAPPVGYSSAPSGLGSTVAPYPTTSIVTVAISSNAPIGTGTGAISPNQNATSTYPPIASYTGAASCVSGSISAVAGLAAIAAFFMA